jgi:hypothetical protein
MSAFRDLAIAAIIPFYNRARFVEESIQSVLAQPTAIQRDGSMSVAGYVHSAVTIADVWRGF